MYSVYYSAPWVTAGTSVAFSKLFLTSFIEGKLIHVSWRLSNEYYVTRCAEQRVCVLATGCGENSGEKRSKPKQTERQIRDTAGKHPQSLSGVGTPV